MMNSRQPQPLKTVVREETRAWKWIVLILIGYGVVKWLL